MARGELFPRVGFILTNLKWSSQRVVRFYNPPCRSADKRERFSLSCGATRGEIMFPSPWRNWLRRLSHSVLCRGQRRPLRSPVVRRRRLQLERLEDRVVPTVTTLANYNGVDFGQSALIQANTIGGAASPPDPQGAVGPHSYIEAINLSVAIFSPQTSGINPTTD